MVKTCYSYYEHETKKGLHNVKTEEAAFLGRNTRLSKKKTL